MKKIIKLATLGLLGTMAFTNATGVRAAEATPSVDETVKSLFETYYADGVYTKDTSIYMTDSAVLESIQYFHAGATQLERTTHYADDALWMSRGNGEYSYYGTAYDGNGEAVGVTNATATTPLVTPKSAPVVLSGTGKESMENYYITMKDFKEFDHEGKWTNVGGVYTTTDATLVDYFRLFTAPCILDTTGSASNYLKFTKATLEQEGTSLVMRLYVDGTDAEGKLTTTDGLFSQATLTNDNKYVYIKGDILTSIKFNGNSSSIYSQILTSETGWMNVGNVARYGFGHGTFDTYEMLYKDFLGISGETVFLPNNWRINHPKATPDNAEYSSLLIIEASDYCFAKFKDNVTNGGYFIGNVAIKKYDNNSNSWIKIKEQKGVSHTTIAPYLSCDYQLMKPGDKLILGITNTATDASRNIDSCTYGVEIAEANVSNTIESVKELLLDNNNLKDIKPSIKNIIDGNEDPYLKIGVQANDVELPIKAGNANGWSGFSYTNEVTMKILANAKGANQWYYSYTAKRSGYINIDQILHSWYACNITTEILIDGEVVYTQDYDFESPETSFDTKGAFYLEKGETLMFRLRNNNHETVNATVSTKKVNLTFVPSATEYALPEGYATLTDYITA